jgi:hypothetical protein
MVDFRRKLVISPFQTLLSLVRLNLSNKKHPLLLLYIYAIPPLLLLYI